MEMVSSSERENVSEEVEIERPGREPREDQEVLEIQKMIETLEADELLEIQKVIETFEANEDGNGAKKLNYDYEIKRVDEYDEDDFEYCHQPSMSALFDQEVSEMQRVIENNGGGEKLNYNYEIKNMDEDDEDAYEYCYQPSL